MKSTKICPKCNHSDIVHFKGELISEGCGDSSLSIGLFSAIPIGRYIYCTCGYTEEWIDREYMEKVKKSKKALK